MKITKKVFLFGLIPVVAQAAICIQMFSLLNSLEYYAEKEAQQSRLDRILVSTLAQMTDLLVAAKTYAAVPSRNSTRLLEQSSKRLDDAFAELRQLAKDDPATLADIEQLISLGQTSKKQFLVYQSITSGDSSGAPMDIDIFRSGRVFVTRLRQANKILERESTQLDATRAKLRDSRNQVKYLVWSELALGLGIIVVLYTLFRYDFARRFSNLLKIADELAQDKPITATIGGRDELTELSQALTRAAEARREATAQKQALFQMVTHDLRSPLMAAMIVVENLLNKEAESTEQKKSRLISVEKSLQRVVGLTNDLLTMEKLDAEGIQLSKVNVDFRETIDLAIETVQALAEQSACRIENKSPSLLVRIDEDRILQVIVNLLGNAIKFSQKGETVIVDAAVAESSLRVEVMDRGPGIKEQDIEQIFHPFQQADGEHKAAGFGLGLAIAKKLVALHEGEMGASRRAGGGTTFWFTLPV